MIARQGAAARKRAVPFGPFLALGGVIGLWFGDDDRRVVRRTRFFARLSGTCRRAFASQVIAA